MSNSNEHLGHYDNEGNITRSTEEDFGKIVRKTKEGSSIPRPEDYENQD